MIDFNEVFEMMIGLNPTRLLPFCLMSAAFIVTAGAQPPDINAKQFESVNAYFVGHWSGSGKFASGNRPVESSLTFDSAAEGKSILIQEAEKPPNNFVYAALLSVDSRDGSLVLAMASNNGGGARVFHSSGWKGNTITFTSTSDLRAWFGFERITWTKLDTKHFDALYEISKDNVAWSVGDEQSFVKVQ